MCGHEKIDQMPDLLSVQQVGKYLQIGKTKAYGLVQDGMIESLRIGRSIRIPKQALVKFIEGHIA